MFPPEVLMGAGVPSEPDFEVLAQRAKDHLAALGVEPHAVYGRTDEALATYSQGLDLLVVGSRGYGTIGRMIHGSTTRQLAGSTRCPLLVLTRQGGRADRPGYEVSTRP
jgi:nucleotide-binding universal stress UspA family protein